MTFTKEHFDRILVFVVFIVTVAIYWFKATPFSEQLVVTVTGGLLGMLIGRRQAQGDTNIDTATVQTPALNTDSMDNSTVNAESVTTNRTQGEQL